MENYLPVNLLGPVPRLIKNNLPGRGLTKVEKHCPKRLSYPGSSLDPKYKEAESFTASSSKLYHFRADLRSPVSAVATLIKLGVGRFRFTPLLKPS